MESSITLVSGVLYDLLLLGLLRLSKMLQCTSRNGWRTAVHILCNVLRGSQRYPSPSACVRGAAAGMLPEVLRKSGKGRFRCSSREHTGGTSLSPDRLHRERGG